MGASGSSALEHRYRGCRKAGCQGALRDRAQGPSATYRELGDSAQQYRNGFSGNQAPGTLQNPDI